VSGEPELKAVVERRDEAGDDGERDRCGKIGDRAAGAQDREVYERASLPDTGLTR
jgi:hypothetical protein